MPDTETAMSPLTIVEIAPRVEVDISDRQSPYYCRVELVAGIESNVRYNRMILMHLGFKAYSKREFRRKGDAYSAYAILDPEMSAQLEIKPFQICMQNVGDGFLKVNVRLRDGMERCKMTLLQESKASREIDDFIEYEGIYYCTTVINCLQTIRIEEIQEVPQP